MSLWVIAGEANDTICDMDGLARSLNERVALNDGAADAELIAAAPKMLAALEAVEKLANNWQKVGKRPDMFDAALHHAAVKLHTAITEALQ